jgi:hypothetical protein
LASKAHRVARGLAGGCALLLGVAISGCAAPQYTYVADSSQNTYFKVPYGWHKLKLTGTSSSAAQWLVAYQAGRGATANDFSSFNTAQPFVFAEVVPLSATESSEMSYNTLRDATLPVTSSARSADTTDGLTGFEQMRDQVLTPGQGVHGVRETFDYTYNSLSDTFDEIALTNADQTVVYLFVLHCTTSCYSHDQTEINDVMSSFTVRSP